MDPFEPCSDYLPDTPQPTEPCCITCRHLDDNEACPELCRRLQEATR